VDEQQFHAAGEVLADAVAQGAIHAASVCVQHRGRNFARSLGAATTPDAIFLLASITKPISVAALLTLFDKGLFRLHEPVKKFIPEFAAGARSEITVLQLLTHVSGLPDQLPENDSLRRRHATLDEFVEHVVRTPLLFQPGTRYSYSSMGILLAAEIARRITGNRFVDLVDREVFRPLEMTHSALGLGGFPLDSVMRCQVERAAPESGGGDPSANAWDWNSPYWRNLGSPWGGAHGSAGDVARFFAAFLRPTGRWLKPETVHLAVQNHNHEGFVPRGLGFGLGPRASSPRCSPGTFAHNGATGTLAWADPTSDTICVVLTTLPERALHPHPCHQFSNRIAAAVA
jgi:CubicO group peptidase (beta-lactamase class C family)